MIRSDSRGNATRFIAHLATGVVGFDCLLASILLTARHPSPVLSAGVDAACALGPLVILLFASRTGVKSWKRDLSRPQTRGALFLRLAVLIFATGQVTRAIYEVVDHHMPFPSLADFAYLSAALCLLLGIVLFLDFPLSLGMTARGFVDSMIVGTAVVTVNWYFVLGPIVSRVNTPGPIKALIVSYPTTDLAVIFAILLLWSQPLDAARRRAATGMTLAVCIRVLVHFAYAYQIVHAAYSFGALASVGRSLCYTLIALVACTVAANGTAKQEEVPAVAVSLSGQSALGTSRAIPAWRALIPYVLTAGVAALAFYSRSVGGDEAFQSGVFIGAGILITLVLIQQMLAFHDNSRLWHRLGDAYHVLETNNQTLSEANVRLRALWESASTDPLTGLPNHRTLMETLNRELERGRRYVHPCTVLFVDLDHFKDLNDSYGHLVGDSILREFSTVVRANLRDIDTLGRWGGEEFAVILPETEADVAFTVAERIREAVATHIFPLGGGVRLTCSIGVAAYPEDGSEREDLIEAADRAMYAAKAFGRNQARAAGDPAVVGRPTGSRKSNSREDTAVTGVVEALTSMLERHDRNARLSRGAAAGLAARVATALGLADTEARMVDLAAQLHDIGKVAVPEAVLLKRAPLADEEWEVMQLHPVAGADVVSRIPALRGLAPMIRGHHERWDGAGYPDGLAGNSIPLGARIVAVVDAYRAMTSDRPYQRARSRGEAVLELRRCTGTQFDPAVVEAFERVLFEESDIEAQDETPASPSVA